MNLKIRRTVFYALILIFLILAFIIIPYSNGWRFDFKTLSFVKLGGIYIETDPAETQIQVDKLSFQIKSGIMKSGLLIANLFPETYRVTAQKEGYQSWSKEIIVKPSLVTQVHQIVLLPQKWEREILAEKVKDFFPGLVYLAWKDTENKLRIDNKVIKGTQFISWVYGDRMALTYDENNKLYFIINAGQNNTASNINLIFNNLKEQKNINDVGVIKNIITHPSDKNKLVISSNKSLYLLDFNKPSLEVLKTGQFKLLEINNDNIFYTGTSTLNSYNLNTKNESIIYNSSNISSIKISNNGQIIAFDNGGKLMLLDKANQDIRQLINNPASYEFSPDNKKIATINDSGEIKAFFIGDDYELFEKKSMSSSVFKITTLDTEYPVAWHTNSAYIFIKIGNVFKLLEINDALPINLQTVNTTSDKYFYNKQLGEMLIIENNILYRLIR